MNSNPHRSAKGRAVTVVEDMQVTSSKEVLKNKLFSVVEEEAHDPNGFHIKRSIVRHPGSAVMMAVDEHERILLVRQFRLPAQAELWELPAGRIDPGEVPLETAKRELHEETGYAAAEWKELVSYFPSPGYVDERMTLFLATGLTAGEAQPMDDERIELRWFSRKELHNEIRTGKIIDGKTLIGFLMWLDRQSG